MSRAPLVVMTPVLAGAAVHFHARDASARAPCALNPRTDLPDALHGSDPQAACSTDASGYEAMSAVDGRDETAWTGRSCEADYGADTGPDPVYPARWHWDPLRDAPFGGMGRLSAAVQNRVAPFLGFCGGAQLLALLEARQPASTREEDQRMIDRVLQRTIGRPIRGFAPAIDVDRAWPTDLLPRRAEVQFLADNPLFFDLAGVRRRSTTHALPEWHADAIRADAFEPGGPLDQFELLAESAFCAPDVVPAGPIDVLSSVPIRPNRCVIIPEAFRSRNVGWPIIGAQFHPEQRDFVSAAPGDPPESTADPRLFLAASYEEIVDAYERFAP